MIRKDSECTRITTEIPVLDALMGMTGMPGRSHLVQQP